MPTKHKSLKKHYIVRPRPKLSAILRYSVLKRQTMRNKTDGFLVP